jgi:MFS family permease
LQLFTGFLSGAAVTLPVTIVASLVPDMKLLGTWMGMSFCFAGMGILIGTPFAGTLINAAENRFFDGFIFSGSVMTAGRADVYRSKRRAIYINR